MTSSAYLSLASLSYCLTHTECWTFLCEYCNITLTKRQGTLSCLLPGSNWQIFPCIVLQFPPWSLLDVASSGFGLKRISLLFYQKSRNNPTYHFSCSLLATFTGTDPIQKSTIVVCVDKSQMHALESLAKDRVYGRWTKVFLYWRSKANVSRLWLYITQPTTSLRFCLWISYKA